MPNTNVGLYSAVIAMSYGANSYGAQMIYPECLDCYRCVNPAPTGGCLPNGCVYDSSYCVGFECADPKVYQNGECVCPNECLLGDQDPDTCECIGCGAMMCTVGNTLNEETCTCEKIKCRSGWYHDGYGCVACPGNTKTDSGVYDPDTFEFKNCGSASLNYGQNGITDCYQVAKPDMLGKTCEYSDDTGTYQLTDDCKYSILGGGIGGGEIIEGGELIKP